MKLQYDKILWNVFGWLFLHKYCTYAQTSAKVFLRLIGKHFSNPSHKLQKICHRSNLKISYSWMPNMKSIISNHNKRISKENVAKKTKKTNKSKIINYIETCETTFKTRFNNCIHSFRDRNKSNATGISKYYWNCIIHNNKPGIKWNNYTSAVHTNVVADAVICA